MDEDDGDRVRLGLYIKRAIWTVIFMLIAIAAFAHACQAMDRAPR